MTEQDKCSSCHGSGISYTSLGDGCHFRDIDCAHCEGTGRGACQRDVCGIHNRGQVVEEAVVERPWTGGPMEVVRYRHADIDGSEEAFALMSDVTGDTLCTVWTESGSQNPEADARVLALAFQMAEAIMWGACDAFVPETGEHECGCPLCELADKLRQIGMT